MSWKAKNWIAALAICSTTVFFSGCQKLGEVRELTEKVDEGVENVAENYNSVKGGLSGCTKTHGCPPATAKHQVDLDDDEDLTLESLCATSSEPICARNLDTLDVEVYDRSADGTECFVLKGESYLDVMELLSGSFNHCLSDLEVEQVRLIMITNLVSWGDEELDQYGDPKLDTKSIAQGMIHWAATELPESACDGPMSRRCQLHLSAKMHLEHQTGPVDHTLTVPE